MESVLLLCSTHVYMFIIVLKEKELDDPDPETLFFQSCSVEVSGGVIKGQGESISAHTCTCTLRWEDTFSNTPARVSSHRDFQENHISVSGMLLTESSTPLCSLSRESTQSIILPHKSHVILSQNSWSPSVVESPNLSMDGA